MRALSCLFWPHCWIEGKYIDYDGTAYISRQCNECGELHIYVNGYWKRVWKGS